MKGKMIALNSGEMTNILPIPYASAAIIYFNILGADYSAFYEFSGKLLLSPAMSGTITPTETSGTEFVKFSVSNGYLMAGNFNSSSYILNDAQVGLHGNIFSSPTSNVGSGQSVSQSLWSSY